MTPERYQQVNRLLDELHELQPAERAARLAAACAGDEELRREVESLLEAHEQAQSFIEAPAAGEAAELLGEPQAGGMVGRTLGHYQLRALLGAGGMGEVYRATDTRLEREVAVKILPQHLAQDAEALHRFKREAKAVAALSHPNVCAIHDFGSEQGVSYAVMELLEGETLRARLARTALSWHEAAQIGAAVADGLAAAHSKGIIHRDLKPENIFLTLEGQAKILDFGIARVKHLATPEAETGTGTMTETTRPGVMIGTIGYMSPEQVRGEAVEAPSDIFSLGCVLYEMVSGRRPFWRGNTMETLAAILKEEPQVLTGANKETPSQVERVIRHCLRKRPEERYQSARELASDLRTLLSVNKSPLTVPVFSRPHLRSILSAGVAAVAALMLGIAAWWYLANRSAPAFDSLAILPLVNLSGDANLEYLSDGIADSLINNLSQLPQLKVMARATVFTYKGQKDVDPRRVGAELKVRAVFTGRMTQRGDTLSIQADLINSAEGSQIWGERYDRKLDSLLLVQDDIARQITEKLRLRLTGAEQKRLAKHHTDNIEAHQLYLKGRYYWNKTDERGLKTSIELFKQAIDLDPNYALAYAGLADSYFFMSNIYLPPKEAMPLSRAAAMKALQLDEALGEAHAALAVVKSQYDWEWEAADRAYRRAIQLNPGYASVRNLYGLFLVFQGRYDEAQVQMDRARELDPLSSYIHVGTIWPVLLARRYDPAIEQLKKIIALNPDFANAHTNLGWAYAYKGRYDEAIAAILKAESLESNWVVSASLGYVYGAAGKRATALKVLGELQERARREHVGAYGFAWVYTGLDEKAQAFEELEKALASRDEYMLMLKVDPFFDRLRADPRYADLLRRMNLAP